jgi:hypothetical protein
MSHYTVTDVWSTSVEYSSKRVKICLWTIMSVQCETREQYSEEWLPFCCSVKSPPPQKKKWKSRSGLKNNKRHANHSLQNNIHSNQSIFSIITQTINGSWDEFLKLESILHDVSRLSITSRSAYPVKPSKRLSGGKPTSNAEDTLDSSKSLRNIYGEINTWSPVYHFKT